MPAITTPIHTGSRTLLRFAEKHVVTAKYQVDLGTEMLPYFVGPMPVVDFLSEFLPLSKLSLPQTVSSFEAGMFDRVVDAKDEVGMYEPFTEILQRHLSNFEFHITATSTDQAKTDFPFKIKPDCSMFAQGRHHRGTDSSTVELFIEFKRSIEDDPFISKPQKSSASSSGNTTPSYPLIKNSMDAREKCGQITTYAASHMSAQYRTHVFFVLICAGRARIIRWDRSGAIVTEPIPYNEVSHLFDFFVRFDCSPPDVRGQDITVRLANSEEIKDAVGVVKELDDRETSPTPLLVVSIPDSTTGKSLQYVIASPLASAWVPVGRWTRTSIGYDIKEKRRIFLKDSWRPDAEGALKEGDIYSLFQKAAVPNVPHCSNSGDIGDDQYHSTQSDLFIKADFNLNYTHDVTRYRHYRLVLEDVGEPLDRFDCSRDMVRAVHAALIAHEAACKAGVLHRDISPGNILITSDPKFDGGLLIDWDLSKKLTSADKPCRAARTGTWQFMAADLVKDPGIAHTFVHDLESSLYVIFWLSIRLLPNSWSPPRRALVMDQVFNPSTFSTEGSSSKAAWMANSSENTKDFEITDNPVLTGLIKTLLHLFAARHVGDGKPTPYRNFGSQKSTGSFMNLQAVDKFLKLLVDHKEVIMIFNSSLSDREWPEVEPATKQDIPVLPDKLIKSSSRKSSSKKSSPKRSMSQSLHEKDSSQKDSSSKRNRTG